MSVNKEMVTRVVDSCYSSPYKIFTINSYDGVHVVKPLGLFVSLGVTTTMRTMSIVLHELIDQLKVNASIAEISSRYVNNRYINNVITEGSHVKQYDSESVPSNGLRLNLDELKDFIFDTKSKIVKNVDDDSKVIELTNRLTKMIKVLNKMEKYPSSFPLANLVGINDNSNFDVYVISNSINYIRCHESVNDTNIVVHKRIGILVNFN